MQGPIHTAAEWARIARSTRGQDLWWSHSLTRLSVNQIAAFNEKGWRCPVDNCAQLVEHRIYSSRHSHRRNGDQPSHRTCYVCPYHAEEFAEIYGLDWPPYVPEQYREEG